MKVSIITVAKNSGGTIERSIRSVIEQTYKDIEYIIIDGASTDNTVEIAGRYKHAVTRLVSEPDTGLYDAMNKGIRLAGGDIVGILNSDDVYYDESVIECVAAGFSNRETDAVYADLIYVDPENPEKVVRYYRSVGFEPGKFAYGLMPAHPTFFVRRACYARYGLFKTDYKIAADFELLARFIYKQQIRCSYIPRIFVKMMTGGTSTKNLMSNWILNREILRACAENGIRTHVLKVLSKYPAKVFQLFDRPS